MVNILCITSFLQLSFSKNLLKIMRILLHILKGLKIKDQKTLRSTNLYYTIFYKLIATDLVEMIYFL
jgi:hypothetical protein